MEDESHGNRSRNSILWFQRIFIVLAEVSLGRASGFWQLSTLSDSVHSQ